MHSKLTQSKNRKDKLETYSTSLVHTDKIDMADAGPQAPAVSAPRALHAPQQPAQQAQHIP